MKYRLRFEQLCNSVIQQYKPILSVFELEFYSHYQTLNDNAKRVFIRLIQHSNSRLKLNDCSLSDIDNLEQTIIQLSALPFVHLHYDDKKTEFSHITLSCQDVWRLYQLLYFGDSQQRLNNIEILEFKKIFISNRRYQNREELEWHLTIISFFEILAAEDLTNAELMNINDCLPNFPDKMNTPAWLMTKLNQLKKQLAKRLLLNPIKLN